MCTASILFAIAGLLVSVTADLCSNQWLDMMTFDMRPHVAATARQICPSMRQTFDDSVRMREMERQCSHSAPDQSCSERTMLYTPECAAADSVRINVSHACTYFACMCERKYQLLHGDERELCDAVKGILPPGYAISDHYPDAPTRVWLLTSTDDTASYVATMQRTLSTYAAKHGYGYSVGAGRGFTQDMRHPYWIKILVLLRAMNMPRIQRLGVEWFIWLDADAMITALDTSVATVLEQADVQPQHDLMLQEDCAGRQAGTRRDWAFNGGVLFIRNSVWSFRFFARLFKKARTDGFHAGTWAGNFGDQSAIVQAYDDNFMDARTHMYILQFDGTPGKCINAFIHGGCMPDSHQTAWRPGCWTAHTAGVGDGMWKGKRIRDCVFDMLDADMNTPFDKIVSDCFGWDVRNC